MPKLTTVRHIGTLPGESHYEVDTPMGTWQVDMVQYTAGSYEGLGYGTAPRWMVTTPGEDRPDSVFTRKRDAVAYITEIVDEDLDKNNGNAARVALEAHQAELHGDNSPWAKVAEQETEPTAEGVPTMKETNAVAENTSKSAACPTHRVADKRGGRAAEIQLPTCGTDKTYGAWSEGAGGFVYAGDCATEVANWAADELRQLAKEDDTDTIEIMAVCPDHEEQPKNGCEECAENDEAEDEDGGDE